MSISLDGKATRYLLCPPTLTSAISSPSYEAGTKTEVETKSKAGIGKSDWAGSLSNNFTKPSSPASAKAFAHVAATMLRR